MLGDILDKVRDRAPLIHNITNHVTSNDCANIILACGALPVMAEDIREAAEITSNADALVINIGTLTEHKLHAMLAAGQRANELGHPIILDPVGVGASSFRREAAECLIKELKPGVIRGNRSEIKILHGMQADKNMDKGIDKSVDRSIDKSADRGIDRSVDRSIDRSTDRSIDKSTDKSIDRGINKSIDRKIDNSMRGVDADEADLISGNTTDSHILVAKELSRAVKAVVVMTGSVDIVTDSSCVYLVHNGHPMMRRIAGSGCMLSAVIGAFCGALPSDRLGASAAAVGAMGLCGELAYAKMNGRNEGSGSFRVYLTDAMYLMDGNMLNAGLRLEERKRAYGIEEEAGGQ